MVDNKAKIAIVLYLSGAAILTAATIAKGGWIDGGFIVGFALVWAAWMVPLWPSR